jgi:cytochrome c biogenesis protein CcmG/thiol:disulfide interchange protein DsbE
MAEANKSTLARTWRYLLPLAIFFGLVGFLWKGLSLNPREIPSALLNKPAPAFVLPQLHDAGKQLSAADMKGKVWLMNVWGSWCVSCRYEHPLLNALAKQSVVPIIGLNWKDKPEDAKAWLAKFGDPYQVSVSDLEGRVAIDYGVYGAPETFIIDKAGMIRLKHTGPITEELVRDKLVPLIRELNKA